MSTNIYVAAQQYNPELCFLNMWYLFFICPGQNRHLSIHEDTVSLTILNPGQSPGEFTLVGCCHKIQLMTFVQ